jgi:hypothetical protein
MAKIKMRVLVLRASRYSMTDEKTGELVEGTKINYVQDLDGETRQNTKGVDVAQAIIPYAQYEELGEIPAWFQGEFDMATNAKGAAMLKPVALKYEGRLKA